MERKKGYSAPVSAFGVEFKSQNAFKRAARISRSITRILNEGNTLEGVLRDLYPSKSDAQLKAMLTSARDADEYDLVPKVLELIKYGLKYQLSCKAIPKDDAYFLALRIYEAPDFRQALKGLLAKRENRYNSGYHTKNGANTLRRDKRAYNKSRVGRVY